MIGAVERAGEAPAIMGMNKRKRRTKGVDGHGGERGR